MRAGARVQPMKIVSGGQSGVDRAALDVALSLGLGVGGWCPHGGWAEDRPIPPGLLCDYPFLQETPSAAPEQRTEWNVRDSDATLVLVALHGAAPSRGTQLTIKLAEQYNRPHLVASLGSGSKSRASVGIWLERLHPISALNIAGPRESEQPGIYAAALRFLGALLLDADP